MLTSLIVLQTQYIFIYRALLEYAQFNDTEINSSCLSSRILELESSIDGEKSLLSKEFEVCHNAVIK